MQRIRMPILSFFALIGVGALINGCSDNPVTTGSGVHVNLVASFSKNSASLPLSKAFGTSALDSIRIDSVVVVVEKIKFFANIDTVSIDSTGSPDNEFGDDHGDRDSALTFRGPFVIHARDTLAVDFADQMLPAGNYNGVQFKIHRLQRGERCEDSDDRDHGIYNSPADSSLQGSSIMIWGAVKENGTWTPFELDIDMELQFKVKGDFTVPESTGSIQIAFHFDLASWFVDPETGTPIDPSNPDNLQDIKRAIRHAFGSVRCGQDWNHDGYPDH